MTQYHISQRLQHLMGVTVQTHRAVAQVAWLQDTVGHLAQAQAKGAGWGLLLGSWSLPSRGLCSAGQVLHSLS